VAQRQIERVSQEMNTRTRDLAADLTERIVQTNNDVVAVRQEMVELGEQIPSKVTDGVKTVSTLWSVEIKSWLRKKANC
jgi:hypothetical protein